MWVGMLKCLHLLVAVSLVAMVLLSTVMLIVARCQSRPVSRLLSMRMSLQIDCVALACGVLQFLLGTLLVYPRGYTFFTPWIDEAYVLLTVVLVGLLCVMVIKRRGLREPHHVLTLTALPFLQLLLLALFGIIGYDAVSKLPVLFFR